MTKREQALDIFQNKMTDAQYNRYRQDFISDERIVDEINDYISNEMDDDELDRFIEDYGKTELEKPTPTRMDYEAWGTSELIDRIIELENQLN